jgi:flagellar biosynthesis protein FlhB
MAGSAGEKTERATPRRREESRKRGQVARSREINTGLGLLATFALLAFLGGWLLTGLAQVMSRSLGGAGTSGPITPAAGWQIMTAAGWDALRLVAPFAAAGAIVGVVASAIQVKPGIMPSVLKPRFSVLNPISGAKRLLGPRSLVSIVKDLIKVSATGAIAYVILRGSIPDLMSLMGAGPGRTIAVVSELALRIGFSIVAVYAFIAVADLLYERWQHERDLRMTRDEVRREAKEQDVNPEIKGQLKRRQREMAVRRMMSAVPDADVVITNPTHFAVALRYAKALPAPRVVAKGADNVAFRIISTARENGVTVVQDPPLARSLFAAAEVGQFIPAEAFEAVAEILAHVYRASGREPAAA